MRMNAYSISSGDIILVGDTQYRVLKKSLATRKGRRIGTPDITLELHPISPTTVTMTFDNSDYIELIAGKQR